MSALDDREQSRGAPPVLSRRRFLGVIAVGSGGVAMASLMAACSSAAPAGAPPQPAPTAGANAAAQAGPGGFANAGTLKILMSSHFVPAYDTWFDEWAKNWGTKNKVEIQADHIGSND